MSCSFPLAHIFFLLLTWTLWTHWYELLICRWSPCYMLGSPRRWRASESKAATQSRDTQADSSPIYSPLFLPALFKSLHICFRPLWTRKCLPPGLLAVACPPAHCILFTLHALHATCPEHRMLCTSHAQSTGKQPCLSFLYFSYKTLMKKQITLILDLLTLKYSTQRTYNFSHPALYS